MKSTSVKKGEKIPETFLAEMVQLFNTGIYGFELTANEVKLPEMLFVFRNLVVR